MNYSDVSTVILYVYEGLWMVYRPEWYQNKSIVEYSYHVGIRNYKIIVLCTHVISSLKRQHQSNTAQGGPHSYVFET